MIFRFQLLIFQGDPGCKGPKVLENTTHGLCQQSHQSHLNSLLPELGKDSAEDVPELMLCVCSWARARKLLNRICMYTVYLYTNVDKVSVGHIGMWRNRTAQLLSVVWLGCSLMAWRFARDTLKDLASNCQTS